VDHVVVVLLKHHRAHALPLPPQPPHRLREDAHTVPQRQHPIMLVELLQNTAPHVALQQLAIQTVHALQEYLAEFAVCVRLGVADVVDLLLEQFPQHRQLVAVPQSGHVAHVVVDRCSEHRLTHRSSTSNSIFAQTMQWMGFSGRMRMVHTGYTFCPPDLG
jgi:hypothetical protein